jgi:hypothetical protein
MHILQIEHPIRDFVRGASGGELPGQAGTKLHACNQRAERGI